MGKGKIFLHFITEQYWAQVVKKVKPSTETVNEAHEYALKENLDILGYTFAPQVEVPQGKILRIDVDLIDKNGNYITTVRQIHDFSDPKHPKFKFDSFVRNDLQPGQNWVAPDIQDDPNRTKLHKYLKDNPNPEPAKKKYK
jgi:hypothetical protein